MFIGFGTPEQRPLSRVTPEQLQAHQFPPGSMGPKVAAACRFVTATGGRAAIGALADVAALVEGRAGTVVMPDDLPRAGHRQPGGTTMTGASANSRTCRVCPPMYG